jgi:transcription elongation GreA/GreB family factor
VVRVSRGSGRGRPVRERRVYLSKKQLARSTGACATEQAPRDSQVVEQKPPTRGNLFSAWFEVEDESGNVQRFRIVGPDETDRARLDQCRLTAGARRAEEARRR